MIFFCHFLNSYHSLNLVSLTPPFSPKTHEFFLSENHDFAISTKMVFPAKRATYNFKKTNRMILPHFFFKTKVYNLNERSQVAVFNLSPAAISQHRKKFSRTLLFPQSTGDFPVYNLAKNNDFSRHRMVSSVTDSFLTQHFSFHPFPPPSSDATIMGVRGNVLKWKKQLLPDWIISSFILVKC